jgi:hypothetical protein
MEGDQCATHTTSWMPERLLIDCGTSQEAIDIIPCLVQMPDLRYISLVSFFGRKGWAR